MAGLTRRVPPSKTTADASRTAVLLGLVKAGIVGHLRTEEDAFKIPKYFAAKLDESNRQLYCRDYLTYSLEKSKRKGD
jgi:hypothetical protein